MLLQRGAQLINELLFLSLKLPALFLDLGQPLQHLLNRL
jgi:hypothetical protein